MQAESKSVHAFQMFYRDSVRFQVPGAIATPIAECRFNIVCVLNIRYRKSRRSYDLATQVVEEHADKLVGNV